MSKPGPAQEQASIHSQLMAGVQAKGSPYWSRLRRSMAEKLRAADARPSPQLLLLPPGLEPMPLLGSLLEDLELSFVCHDCRVGGSAARAINPGEAADVLLLLNPEQLDSNECASLLAQAEAAAASTCLIASVYPPWSTRSGGQFPPLLDFRDFCYRSADIQYLLACAAEQQLTDNPRAADAFELLRLTGGWPVLTEGFISRLGCNVQQHGNTVESAQTPLPVLASEAGVRKIFEQAWLPLLLSRHPWLLQTCTLPMLNLDVLVYLFPGISGSVREGLAMGLLQPCSRRPGFYQVSTSLEGLVLAAAANYRDTTVLEQAARWYEQQGYLSEAIECLVTLGVKEEILSALHEKSDHGGAGVASESASAESLANLGPPSRVARAALGSAHQRLPRSLGVSIAGRRARPDSESSSVESPGVESPGVESPAAGSAMPAAFAHILSAYHHHRGNNAGAVGSSMAAAVESGVNREQLSSLIDFIDVHIRPLVQDKESPLSFALKDVRHSAPAREAVAAQSQRLNHRELQILQRICEGYKNREISEQLGLELSTIKWYSTRIYEKLQVRNRTQAVARAQVLRLFG